MRKPLKRSIASLLVGLSAVALFPTAALAAPNDPAQVPIDIYSKAIPKYSIDKLAYTIDTVDTYNVVYTPKLGMSDVYARCVELQAVGGSEAGKALFDMSFTIKAEFDVTAPAKLTIDKAKMEDLTAITATIDQLNPQYVGVFEAKSATYDAATGEYTVEIALKNGVSSATPMTGDDIIALGEFTDMKLATPAGAIVLEAADYVTGETLLCTGEFGGKIEIYTPSSTLLYTVPVVQGALKDNKISLTDTGMLITDHINYVIGYPEGDVRPDNNITRAEAATIFFRLLNEDVRKANAVESNTYSDVNIGDWFNVAISTLSKLEILNGYYDGTFKPDAYITRGEFATIAARFDKDTYSGPDMFSDIANMWCATYVNKAADKGWVKGYPGAEVLFRPDQNITRAEVMTLVNRVLGRDLAIIEKMDPTVTASMATWTDNMDTAKWFYDAIQEATNYNECSFGPVDYTLYELWLTVNSGAFKNIDWTTWQY